MSLVALKSKVNQLHKTQVSLACSKCDNF